MSRIPEHNRGYRDGIRAAVSWLHKRAGEMNDPHAQAVLNSAATNLGWDFSQEVVKVSTTPDAIRAGAEGRADHG